MCILLFTYLLPLHNYRRQCILSDPVHIKVTQKGKAQKTKRKSKNYIRYLLMQKEMGYSNSLSCLYFAILHIFSFFQ
ncbi:MAG: hypothetical protein AYK18_14000 [Theionarchaea archaeon DG-70]|nr:MAG: hypothetical protein AYK18_14000 [Theionarchaea archaeon DG-70]